MSVTFPPIVINERYRLDAEIGRGAMGGVYRGLDLLLQREIAVKVLPLSLPAEQAGNRAFLNEAQSAARLNHPNIVAVYDAGEAEFDLPGHGRARRAYLVMQFVDGRSLNDLLGEARRLDLPRVVEIVRQLCAALEAAHAAGIIHRDLKPENVLIAADGSARLTDFGLASWLRPGRDGSEETGEIVGAVFYMAPEFALGRPFDRRADLYSLGVMLYEMLAGRLPFEAVPGAPNDPIPVIAQHLHAPPTPPSTYNPDIPPAIEALTLRLLSKDPADRPATAAEVDAALAAALAASARRAGLPATQTAIHPSPQTGSPATTGLEAPAISPIERITRGRMVGRLGALQEVGRAWNRAAAGQGGVLLVSGEPGIGKTRLVRELAARAEVSGGRALTGVCYPQTEAPLDPILQLAAPLTPPEPGAGRASPLDRVIRAPLGGGSGLASALRGEWSDRSSGSNEIPFPRSAREAQAGEGDPRLEQERLFSHLAGLFVSAAESAPLLLIVEDAHWADSGTLAFVRRLARQAGSLRLLVVLTYREVELSESRALTDLLTDLNRERLANRIKLARLGRDETAELLFVMFDSPQASLKDNETFDAFTDRVYEETEGNPFFIEELVKALIEEGQIVFENGRWRAAALDNMRLPQSVRLAVRARVERLPEPAREALRIAAVFGRKFEFDALLQVSNLDEDALVDALDAAERAQLIAEANPPGSNRPADPAAPPGAALSAARSPAFTFTHALIPAALQDDLGRLRRQRLHRSAGLALEKLYPLKAEKMACRLSRHFLEGGDSERAVHYLALLGDQAFAVFAYAEAIESYEQVIEFLRDSGLYEKASRYLMKLGLLYHVTYEFARSQQAYAEAFDMWQRAGPAPAAAPAPHPLRTRWGDPTSLDPTRIVDQTSIEIARLFFEGLMELTADMNIRPGVAARWQILNGGRRYVFHLRRDCVWNDGRPVTAHDFEFAWKRILDPARSSPVAGIFYGVAGARLYHDGLQADPDSVGIRARDNWTLEVEMEEPLGYFLHLLAANALPIPRHKYEELGEDWACPENLVGNGPFTLTEWIPGERLSARRNPSYRGSFPGNVESLVLYTRADDSALLEQYERGELDMVSAPLAAYDRARFQYPGEMLIFPWLLTTYLGFNSTTPPLSDRRVRQALVMAADRATMNGKTLNGLYAFTYGGFLPPSMPGHAAGAGLPYDPDGARRLLAEAGFPGGRDLPEFEFRIPLHESSRRGSQFLIDGWLENLGVRVRLVTIPAIADVHKTSGLWSLGWSADYPDPDSFLRMLIGTYPEFAVVEPEYHRLVNTARSSLDQAERLRLYQAADRILVGNAYLAPLSYGQSHLLVKPWVQNYRPHPMCLLRPKDIVITEH